MHYNSEVELRQCVRRHIQIVRLTREKGVTQQHLFQFMEEKGPGLASLLYSIVMSKGIEL